MSFKSEETQKAFLNWLKWLDGGTIHPNDAGPFYNFVYLYCKNCEKTTKESFCAIVRKHIHTSRTHNYGVIQKMYNRLIAVQKYLESEKTGFSKGEF